MCLPKITHNPYQKSLPTPPQRPTFGVLKNKKSTTMSFEPNLTIGECVVSYFLMMAIILAGGFIGQWWIAGFGLLFFLRGVTGFCAVKERYRLAKSH
jgi:hypothetical protein